MAVQVEYRFKRAWWWKNPTSRLVPVFPRKVRTAPDQVYARDLIYSAAMSRRIATDSGGRRGPQSSRTFGGRDDSRGHRDNDRRMDRDDRQGSNNPNNMPIGVMPSMPFPMNFGNMPGMPAFPPGFQLPNFQQQNNQD